MKRVFRLWRASAFIGVAQSLILQPLPSIPNRLALWALTTLMVLTPCALLQAQEKPNRVLQLSGGTNSWLELPSGAFNDLEEATI